MFLGLKIEDYLEVSLEVNLPLCIVLAVNVFETLDLSDLVILDLCQKKSNRRILALLGGFPESGVDLVKDEVKRRGEFISDVEIKQSVLLRFELDVVLVIVKVLEIPAAPEGLERFPHFVYGEPKNSGLLIQVVIIAELGFEFVGPERGGITPLPLDDLFRVTGFESDKPEVEPLSGPHYLEILHVK